MLRMRLEALLRDLPPDWQVDYMDDGTILVTSPEREADMLEDVKRFISEIEQPLTLSYVLVARDKATLDMAKETATRYGLALVETGSDRYRVAPIEQPLPKPDKPRRSKKTDA